MDRLPAWEVRSNAENNVIGASIGAIHEMNARKALNLMKRPAFVRALMTERVAAAVEHLEAIRFTKAAALVDVGANKGQFSLAFRALRPGSRIAAFEPLPQAADTYERVMGRLGGASLFRCAISNQEGTADFFVTDRSDSSSLLKPGTNQYAAFHVREAKTITVPLRRLDDCVDLGELPKPVLMKIDVQGAELRVLQGCEQLERVDFIYAELSFVELYEGQPLYSEITAYLGGRGFEVAGVFNQVVTSQFGPTQADVLFRRVHPTRADEGPQAAWT